MRRSNVVTRRRLHNRKVLALLFGLFFVLTASSAFASVITSYSNTVALQNGLVGWWTFDGKNTHWDTGKTDDSSGNGNSGSLISMSTTTSPVLGKIGQALKCDGSASYVNVPYSAVFQVPKITVSFWLKVNAGMNTKATTVLARGYDGSTADWFFDVRNDLQGTNACSGSPCYLVWAGFPGGTVHGCLSSKDFSTDTPSNIGKWFFVTGTFDGSTCTQIKDTPQKKACLRKTTILRVYRNCNVKKFGAKRGCASQEFGSHLRQPGNKIAQPWVNCND
jgi:hypothetical protein